MSILFKDHNTILFKEEFTRYYIIKATSIACTKVHIYTVQNTQTQSKNQRIHDVQIDADTTYKSTHAQRAQVRKHNVQINAQTTYKSTHKQRANVRIHHVQKYAYTTYKHNVQMYTDTTCK